MTSSAADPPDVLEVELAPDDNEYERKSDAWEAEMMDLDHAVRSEMPEAIKNAGGPTTKGDPVTIGMLVVHLLSTGAVGTLVGCMKTWISAHPGRRRLVICVRKQGGATTLSVDADNIDDEVIKTALAEWLKNGG